MANTRTFSAATAATAPSVNQRLARPPIPVGRHRLRAVDRDEAVRADRPFDVADFLPPGATWLPAPQHTLPTLPGRPPMIGYLVLVPADQYSVPGQLPGAEPLPGPGPDESALSGPVRIDGVDRTAAVDGQPMDLTYLEFELLAHLVAHPHRVHTRDQLVTTVWGYGHVGDGRTVDVHIARLRRKLGAEHRHTIQTVRRVGYKYAP
ncbi:winged helix-turn-helix domain-containing protein [Streptomyces sp. H27-C3]|uniref:winged helix-turn-helix domain-containing protein n=1 Tax=Streptomyces sp. H27-C3 TaxID=3046305 RepID=UPI0024B8DD4F|nr:winged helix-turn-helix domain-containing protein [Streptomyces sp. H27-C3]MDJ0461432.1 winged helix-turn-helix domain-containing protein [Streptomyces sp. H27-C3]